MLAAFIVSCIAFMGGSWVYPCEQDGCEFSTVRVPEIWTCGPFKNCHRGDCQYYKTFVPPYVEWEIAGAFFFISLFFIPAGILLGLADFLYQCYHNPADETIQNNRDVTSSCSWHGWWHGFMQKRVLQWGRNASIVSFASMAVGLLAFGSGFGKTGDKSPPVYPCGICGENSGPFSLDNCDWGADLYAASGACSCLFVASLMAFFNTPVEGVCGVPRTKTDENNRTTV
jgi:hypothetical protein